MHGVNTCIRISSFVDWDNVMIKYTQGFAFTDKREWVLLIEKDRGPDGIIGKWIGLGGKLEPDETLHECMAREMMEEAAVETQPEDWKHFCTFGDGETFEVYCFMTDLPDNQSLDVEGQETERVEFVNLDYILEGDLHTTRHLPYLVRMAMDDRIAFPPPYIRFDFSQGARG